MKVKNAMSRDVEFIEPDANVQAAALLMGEIDVGALPVGNETSPQGVLTSRDILYRVCSAGLDPTTTIVRDVMTGHIHSCGDEEDLEAALDLMAGYHVRRLLVRDDDDQCVGWITLGDISRRLLIDSAIVRDGLAELGRGAGSSLR